MRAPVEERIDHMLTAAADLKTMLAGRDADVLETDRVIRAAFERFLEIISEASRHIPDDLKATEPTIPWPRVADLGNWLRHTYERIDSTILWNIYVHDLDALTAALHRIKAAAESSSSK